MSDRAWAVPLSVLAHPVRCFEELKFSRRAPLPLSFAILVLLFLSEVFNRQMRAFPFNPFRPDRLNVLLVLAQTVVPFLLWVVANWSLCTLMDGEGRFVEIWVATSYALLPVILITFLVAALSNVMTLEEGAFITIAEGVRQIWFVVLLTAGMKVVHQYSFKKTLLSMILTVAGMLIIVFLGVLVFSLFQQLYIFLRTVYSEILFRS